MQFTTLAALFALSSSHAVTAQLFSQLFPCGFNICALAVAIPDSYPALSVRRADCSSFLQTTVQTGTATATSTVSATITTTIGTTLSTSTLTTVTNIETVDPAPVALVRRATITPSSLPIYAAVICNPSAYRSVCSCIGVTASTITGGPTPTITSLVSVTDTSTETSTSTSVILTVTETETSTETRQIPVSTD